MVGGFRVSQAIHVAAELGISDLLSGGPLSADELAARARAHPRSLYRLLRALSTVGVYEELPDGRFRSTAIGEALRSDAPDSLTGWARLVGRPYFWQAWSALGHSVRTGENAFRSVYGEDVWSYRAARPEESEIFDGAMTALASTDVASVMDAYDFGRFDTIADIGGGRGAFLAAILDRWPHLTGVLTDQAHVVAGAPKLLEAAGVAQRCRIEAGSFFDAVPTDADAYVLKSVIHDWADEDSVRILATCRRDMPADAVVLLVERVLTGLNQNPVGAFSDLNMLVAPGGQERTEDEYRSLLASAGLSHVRTTVSSSGYAVVEAVRA